MSDKPKSVSDDEQLDKRVREIALKLNMRALQTKPLSVDEQLREKEIWAKLEAMGL
jgi:hypothetical protein